ncbi:hypothetical protein BDR04DRAFT_1120032 [Suillus decipiens]|nr:hypothetical protein BDR04DRAFT_1120032 [Suillus decipiens]
MPLLTNVLVATHHVDDETVCIKGKLLSGHCPVCGTYTRYQQSPADGDNEPFTEVETCPALSTPAPGVIINPAMATVTIEALSANPATQTGPTLSTMTEPAAIPASVAATVTGEAPSATPATQMPAVGPTPPSATLVSQTTLVGTAAGTSTSSHWHNVHQHVVGVLGACFGCHSTLSNAQAAYVKAVKDGGVMEVPL